MVFIFRVAENPFFSASCNLWKGVYETMFQKVFQVIIQIIYGFAEKGYNTMQL